MKFFAMLKDSVREALDARIFYVMVGLSCLVILLVASISFVPVTPEGEVRRLARNLNWLTARVVKNKGEQAEQFKPPTYDVVDFHQTNDAAEPWHGDYQFTFVVTFPNATTAALVRASKQFSTEGLQKVLKQSIPWFENVTVKRARPADRKEARFLVTTRGTSVQTRRGWPHEPRLLFGLVPLTFWHSPLSDQVSVLLSGLVGTIGAGVAMLVSTIITASFIPTMLRKGTVDLLLVKPIHRPTLLLYKYVGGLSFMFLNTALIIVGVWAAVGLRSGLWVQGFLLMGLVLTLEFAVFYACSTLFGVLTRSPVVAILMCCLLWAILFGVGIAHIIFEASRLEDAPDKPAPEWVMRAVGAAHYVLPRVKDLDVLNEKLVNDELFDPGNSRRKRADKLYAAFSWGENLTVTGAFIALFVGLASLRFATRDY